MEFYVNHVEKPTVTWQRLWEILIAYMDHDLESADIAYVHEFLPEIMTYDEMKELGIAEWLGFEEEGE